MVRGVLVETDRSAMNSAAEGHVPDEAPVERAVEGRNESPRFRTCFSPTTAGSHAFRKVVGTMKRLTPEEI